jgi:murein DD-endopeptidase MepM/ murein hydrolase activator NlpD
MGKFIYQFNHATLMYEKIEKKFSTTFVREILPQIVLSIVFGISLFYFSSRYFSSPEEKALLDKSRDIKLKFELLNKDIDKSAYLLNTLEKRDDNVYRMVFEADPLSEDQRRAGFGGSDRYAYLSYYENSELLINTTKKVDILSKRMLIQSESYKDVMNMVNNKEEMAACIPAIQPIALDKLTRFGSPFGRRLHPILHIWKMHTGIDLTAPTGTEIHAAGDGIVFKAGYSGGYGNCIRLNHGFGYVTVYGHLSKILVRPGQKIKRGDVIGLVGSTGLSTSPHLHYEVRVNGEFVDPINFYYNDMTDEEYQKMLESSSTSDTHIYE